MFNWEQMEPSEYQRSATPSFVELTTRSYITATGTAQDHTADQAFLRLAAGVVAVAQAISDSAKLGINVSGFKTYRPYPVQAVWTSTGDGETEQFKIWLKQPLFIHADTFEAAKAQTSLDDEIAAQIQFEQLAEGTEIQATGTGKTGMMSETLQGLRLRVDKDGYQLVDPEKYREVYLDGLPISEQSDILFRLEIDPNVGQPPISVVN
ncbi:hypothetical protein [Secundilactobacillus folii]|uniref:Uncharacterized protein n=1 Tax=Secundilactobacillus folii TaxID=2678357 RepID=A0A7X2XV94_9LACO|nr:hypothetical protein [Secundilactobacillus folii]MTV82256.1 hypothetical protein [Secundilactobacillus folii]